jgi:hypothetical protein
MKSMDLPNDWHKKCRRSHPEKIKCFVQIGVINQDMRLVDLAFY